MLPKGMNYEAKHRECDAGIGHVKRRPWMRIGNVQVKKQEIDYVTVKKAIGEISQDPGKQQAKRNIAPRVRRAPANKQRDDKEQGDARNGHEKAVIIFEGAESGAGIGDIDEVKETGHHLLRLVRIDVLEDEVLGQLIQRVKRQREEQDEFHLRLL